MVSNAAEGPLESKGGPSLVNPCRESENRITLVISIDTTVNLGTDWLFREVKTCVESRRPSLYMSGVAGLIFVLWVLVLPSSALLQFPRKKVQLATCLYLPQCLLLISGALKAMTIARRTHDSQSTTQQQGVCGFVCHK
jgi:hypothetical protein